jgi:hypothetical protein
MMSFEDGLSILRKIQEESSRIYVHFVEHDKEERFSSEIRGLTDDGVLALKRYEVALLAFNLEGVTFRYEDPRVAANPEKAAEFFDSCLELSWPNGSRCRLYVVRDDFDPIS